MQSGTDTVFIPQSVSSFSTSFVRPTGQFSHAVACVNGFKFGCAMNVPEEQHPKRPAGANSLVEDNACH